jgi:hypothetical protein
MNEGRYNFSKNHKQQQLRRRSSVEVEEGDGEVIKVASQQELLLAVEAVHKDANGGETANAGNLKDSLGNFFK